MTDKLNLTNSNQVFTSAQELMPGGVSSPVRAFKSVNGQPIVFDRVKGPFAWDVDGNRYIDYIGSWGPAICGHAHPEVITALQEAIEKGTSFGAPCELENQLAEKVIQAVPSVEMVRFVNSGTEACMAVLRLIRAFTGRDKIINFLEAFNHASGPRSRNSNDMLDYIRRRNDDGELIDWSVAVMFPGGGNRSDLEIPTLPEIKLTRRGRMPRGSIDEIMDKMHVAADLDGYPDNFRGVPNVREEARNLRRPENGLLILYILDPTYEPDPGLKRGYVPLFDEGQQKFEVVAFGLGIPDSDSARAEEGEVVYYHPRGVPGNV